MKAVLITALIAAWVCVVTCQQITVYPAYNLTFSSWYWCDANNSIFVDNTFGLWRTTNAGLTLTRLNFRALDVTQDNINRNMLRFMRIDGSFAETRNCGATFSTYPDTSVHMHHYVVVNNEASGYLLGTNIIYGCDVSTDFGRTWTNVYSGNGVSCQFGRRTLRDKTYDSQLVYVVDDSVLKVIDRVGSAAQTVPGLRNVVGIAWSQNYMFAGANNDGYFELWVSANAGSGAAMNWTRAGIPRRHYNSFFLLDDQSGGLWLGASDEARTGDLFTSSYDATQFKTSASHVVRTYAYDFASVAGIEGIYIINMEMNTITQSFITFNDGAHWDLIPAPAGSGCYLSDGCSLHLHGNSQFSADWDGKYQGYASVYSSRSAVGLILAVGNTGQSLSTNISVVNTYFSRDAGLTWTVLFNGSQIYEFGDHGGILVMADNRRPTDIINYSLDEGLSWTAYKLPAPVEVENIMVESDMGTSFVVLTKNTTFGIDFSTLHSRICDSSDYELWSPSDGRSTQRCILGRDVIYSRRIRDSKCYNPRTTEHIVNMTSCPCTEDDYECDIGFIPSSYNEKTGLFSCIWAGSGPNPMETTSCTPGTTYNVTQGYKLAAGDTCQEQGGRNLLPVTQLCPGSGPSDEGLGRGVIGAILIIVFIVIALVALVVGYKLKKLPEALSTKIDALFGGGNTGQGKKYTLLGADQEDEEQVE